jgi:2',3'-cyclic-nucleotide 2'-phosphodiesterase/3'-nucleotidase/5'-nucleotidase
MNYALLFAFTCALLLSGNGYAQPIKNGFIRNESSLTLELIGSYSSGLFGQSAAEISAYDAGSQRLFVTNASEETVDILDISDPGFPKLVKKLNVGGGPNSVDVYKGLVAVAIEANPKTEPGWVNFYDVNGMFLKQVFVGALPDMLTFTKNGKYLIIANEGEPNDDYSIDPEGSISIIDMRDFSVRTITFSHLNSQKDALIKKGIRIFGPNATVAQDLEPEYIATSDDSRFAWVTLQENNAIAKIDIANAQLIDLWPLGFKDHSLPGNQLDASDRDNSINIRNWPIKGIYMPDAIAHYSVAGKNYLVTANEGDAREYTTFVEAARVSSLTLDPVAFPNAAQLRQNANLGRLNVTSTLGDTDGDGDYDELYSFGARSFSIWSDNGKLIFDSGDEMERITAEEYPTFFNSSNNSNSSFDTRSDDKGPEPEGVVIGKIKGRTYAFFGLERISGIMVYDISIPEKPRFVEYVNNRNFNVAANAPDAGDLGVEGLIFISEGESPIQQPLLVTTNEVSGTTSIFRILTENSSSGITAFSVYPNPAIDQVSMNLPEGEKVQSLFASNLITSRSYPLKTELNTDNTINVNVEELPKGMYNLVVRTDAGTYHHQLIKK